MIEQADILVRMIAIGAALMLVALIAANDVRARIQIPLLGTVIGAIAYLVNASPLMMGRGPLDPFISLVAILTPFWIWLFARRLFEREPERRIVLGLAAVLLFGWVMQGFVPSSRPFGFVLLHLVLLGLIVDLIRVGVFERDDDLVEQRRVIRVWLPSLVAAQAGAILLFELFAAATGMEGRLPAAQLIGSVLILLLMLFAGLAILRTDPELLVETQDDHPRDDAPAARDLSPAQSVLHGALKQAMAQGVYREQGLTIARLADKLDTPEHRLRALINQGLGYRNFSAFLNHHRIAEARDKLTSRDEAVLPVLTIAMDLGYNSLPTFNRAFRAETGTSPGEFRRAAFAQDDKIAALNADTGETGDSRETGESSTAQN